MIDLLSNLKTLELGLMNIVVAEFSFVKKKARPSITPVNQDSASCEWLLSHLSLQACLRLHADKANSQYNGK